MSQFAARKSLGQHFLSDPDILARAAIAAGPVRGRAVIEVGPGPGGLTRALLSAGAAPVLAVEADQRFALALGEWPEAASGRLIVLHADARTLSWPDLLQEHGISSASIVANLPYNIATPLLLTWLMAGSWRQNMALMLQKEVAMRICAPPSSREYGRLSVMVAARMRPFIAFTLPPGAFQPKPRVESAMLVLEPLKEEQCCAEMEALSSIVMAAFSGRRKMLRSALRAVATPQMAAEDLLARAGIDPKKRAENLDQQAFRALATALATARRDHRSLQVEPSSSP